MKNDIEKKDGTEIPKQTLADQTVTEEELTPPCLACGDTGVNTIANGAVCFCQQFPRI